MRAFVAGATGFTGREVVRELAELGHQVVAHVRPDSKRLSEWRSRFEDCGADIDTTPWQPDAMAATFAERAPELVFALLGTTRHRARAAGMSATDAYQHIDYGLTALLIDAAAAMPKPPRFIYLSSIGTHPGVRNPYLAARAKVEARLEQSSLPFVIARPSFISGERDEGRPGERAAAVTANALLGLAGLVGAHRLRNRYRSMTGAELATALTAAGLDPECTRRVLQGEDLRALIGDSDE